MRVLVRLAIAGLALFAVAVAALAVLLPRIAASDAVREQIETTAERLFGREVRYADLGVGLFPPSVVVQEPRIAGAGKWRNADRAVS